MEAQEAKRLSKFMSLILRHRPEVAGLALDAAGWVEVDTLLAGIRSQNSWRDTTREDIDFVVATNDKKRFEYDVTATRIRASQGHSVEVELGYAPKEPPELLYHGTAEKFLSQIVREGLKKQTRSHVHLSADEETARKVGSRHGKPVVLIVCAQEMATAGYEFFLSTNGVWLTERVPTYFIRPVDRAG